MPNFNNASTFVSSLNVSGNTTLQGFVSCLSTLTGTTINATSFVEAGQALSTKYLQSATLNNYVLKAGDTMTGALVVANSININGATNAAQSLFFRNAEYNIGIAGTAGNYSSWAAQSDMVIRTLAGQKLILQAGIGTGAISINLVNNVGIGINSFII